MLKRIVVLIFIASGFSACTSQTQQSPLLPADIGVSSIDISVAPSATIFWPSRTAAIDGDLAARSQYAAGPAIRAVKQAYEQEFRGVFRGPHKVRLTGQIVSVYVMSERARSTRIGVGGFGGAGLSIGGAGLSSAPAEVSVRIILSVIDAKTGVQLASTPITTVISPDGLNDAGLALFRQNAIDANNWLLTVRQKS